MSIGEMHLKWTNRLHRYKPNSSKVSPHFHVNKCSHVSTNSNLVFINSHKKGWKTWAEDKGQKSTKERRQAASFCQVFNDEAKNIIDLTLDLLTSSRRFCSDIARPLFPLKDRKKLDNK